MRRLLAPLLLLAFLGLLAVGLLRPRSGNAAGTALAGQPAPNFTLQTLDGGRVSLAQFRGRPVLVNFWASWCEPCRDEAPLLRQAAVEHAEKGLVVLGVVYQDTPQNARKFRDEFALGFPVLLDEPGAISVQYGLSGLPDTYFIDREGRIAARHPGALTAADLERRLGEVLE